MNTNRQSQLGFRRVSPCRDLIWRTAMEDEKQPVIHCHAMDVRREKSVPRPNSYLIRTLAGFVRVTIERDGITGIAFEETAWERCHNSLDPEETIISDLREKPTHKHEKWLKRIEALLLGEDPLPEDLMRVTGTEFQKKVWDAVREIPFGQTMSYKAIAQKIGSPKAFRAVANACAENVFALWIPCHRVVREDGGAGDYKWGAWRKDLILDLEFRFNGD